MTTPTAFARQFTDSLIAVEFIHDGGKVLITVPTPARKADESLSDTETQAAHSKARELARAFLEHTGGI